MRGEAPFCPRSPRGEKSIFAARRARGRGGHVRDPRSRPFIATIGTPCEAEHHELGEPSPLTSVGGNRIAVNPIPSRRSSSGG